MVENKNLTRHGARRQGAELLPVIYNHDLGSQPLGWRGHAAAKGCQDNFLRGSRRLAGPRNHFGRFRATNPVGDFCLFQRHLGAQCPHLRGHVINGTSCLRRSAQARANVVGQMAQLVQRIGVGKCRIA